MLLAADVGNTHITVGLFQGKKLEQTFRLSSNRERTSDEFAVLLLQTLHVRGVEPTVVSDAIVSSVVPQLTEGLCKGIEIAFGIRPLSVGPGTKTGMPIRYDSPREVGADRIVNSVAAYHIASKGVIVVDFGTATTFDCVSPQGEYLGGVIAPGIEVSLKGLLDRAAKLRPIELIVPPTVLGRNTTHSLQSGVMYGYAALIDGLVAKLRSELGFECLIFATGGLSPVVGPHTSSIQEIYPNLTLDGLQIIWELNRHQAANPAE